MLQPLRACFWPLLGLALLMPASAQAYVGPGLGLGVIGAVLGVLVSLLVALGAIIWYPLKRLLRRKAKPVSGASTQEDQTPPA